MNGCTCIETECFSCPVHYGPVPFFLRALEVTQRLEKEAAEDFFRRTTDDVTLLDRLEKRTNGH